MHKYTIACLVLGLCATLAVGGTRARAQDTGETEEAVEPGVSIADIQDVRNMRCDAMDRAKRASRKADAYVSSAATMPFGPQKVTTEDQGAQARAEADSGYTEASRLKKQVAEMVDRLLAEQQALLDATTDEEARAQIEATMASAQEIRDGGCP